MRPLGVMIGAEVVEAPLLAALLALVRPGTHGSGSGCSRAGGAGAAAFVAADVAVNASIAD